MSTSLLLLLSLSACSNGWFGGGKDPVADTANDADADTDADSDTDSDSDADSDSDSDTDADADTDPDPDTVDDDGDGYSEDEGDCDDTDSSVGPGETEVPYDGVDNDCDPSTPDDDLDGDGYNADTDCDDTEADVYPGAPEDISDGADNDCDGKVDERFEIETADASCDCGFTSTIAVDSTGQVHVAYLNSDTGELMYVGRSGSSWGTSSVIDANAWSGEWLDGEMDGADRFQVAYSYYGSDSSYGYGTTSVYFGYRDSSGVWDTGYLVDNYDQSGSTSVGNYVQMAVDSSNVPSFLYQDEDGVYDLGLGYSVPVVRTFADFSLLTLDISSALDITYYDNSGYFTDIAVDGSDTLYAAWYDSGASFGNGEVQFIRPIDYLSLTLQETVYADPGYWVSLAMKSDDTPCVAFQEPTGADVMYGCRDSSGSWSTETVETAGAIGEGTQLAFNSSDEPYIAYYNETSGALRVSHHDGSSWSSFQVDGSGGDVGKYPSMTIDSSDVVHLSYYDVDNGQLLYAYGQ